MTFVEPITLSIADTCKALGIGRNSVYKLLAEQRLDAIKVGSRTLIRADSIRRLAGGE